MLFISSGDCLLTDLPEMVPLMKKNVSTNSSLLEGVANVKPFEWGTEISSLVPHKDQSFHIVIAADCIYYKEVIQMSKQSIDTNCIKTIDSL